jgi:hypothetical protein
MRELSRVENEDGSKGRLNDEDARCDGGRGGGGSHAAASPSFLVLI